MEKPRSRQHALTRRKFVSSATAAAATCAVASTAALIPRPAKAAAPVWNGPGNQLWAIGQPVLLDLADFVTDPDGDPLQITLDVALPPGVTLNGTVISGTPTAEFPTTQYVVTADDGVPGPPEPRPPTGLTAD
jgi:hypothetical protein